MTKTAQDIVIKPIITEDSMERLQSGKYTFEVAKDAVLFLQEFALNKSKHKYH